MTENEMNNQAAQTMHPDALPDGTLSKSTAKRLAAASVGRMTMAEYTTGHCPNHNQPGGCQLHNLQCGWPNCDRKPVEHNPSAAASVSERARAILKSEMGGFGTDTQGRIPLEYALRAIEQALTQQRDGDAQDKRALAKAVFNIPVPGRGFHEGWRDEEIWQWALRAAAAHILGATQSETEKLFTTPQPSADAVREIYDAAAKGFHTSETNGAERKYLHVIRFQSIEDLHGYEDAWTAAMVKARDAK